MNNKTTRLNFIVEKTDTGFSAYSVKYPVYTTGVNFRELQSNGAEALNLYLEKEPTTIFPDNIELEIDFHQFFQYYRVINAKFLAKRIGMNETLLSQYVQGKKKPSIKQKNKILNGIHEIGKELCSIGLF